MRGNVLLTIAQAASRLKISERRLQELCAAGEIDGATRFGGAWAIPDPPRRTVERPRGRPRKVAPETDTR